MNCTKNKLSGMAVNNKHVYCKVSFQVDKHTE